MDFRAFCYSPENCLFFPPIICLQSIIKWSHGFTRVAGYHIPRATATTTRPYLLLACSYMAGNAALLKPECVIYTNTVNFATVIRLVETQSQLYTLFPQGLDVFKRDFSSMFWSKNPFKISKKNKQIKNSLAFISFLEKSVLLKKIYSTRHWDCLLCGGLRVTASLLEIFSFQSYQSIFSSTQLVL